MEQKIKIVRKSGFTHIPNPPLRDQALTLQSKGLFCMMLSFPEGWDFTIGGLASVCNCGRDKIRSCLKNLEDAGYLLREQAHGETGQFAGNVYVLYDEKSSPLSGFPATGKPATGKPLTGNPTEYNKDLINERKNTPLTPQGGGRAKRAPKSKASWKPERFEGFWRFYPKQGQRDRPLAVAEWDALKPDDALIAEIGRALIAWKASDEWQRGIAIPYAGRWLRKRKWLEVDTLPRRGAEGGGRTVERPGDYEI